MMHIVKGIQEALGIRLKADVAPVQAGLEFLVLGIEGILAIGAEGVALQEERMGSVAHDIVVGILTALGHDALGSQTAIVLPKVEVSGNVTRVADFLQGQHIRPEGIDETGVVLLQQLTESQAGVQQQVCLFPVAHALRIFGIVIVAEDVIRHGLDIQAGTLIRNGNPLCQLDEVMGVHIVLHQLGALLGAGQGKQRFILVAGENPVKILHHHGKA